MSITLHWTALWLIISLALGGGFILAALLRGADGDGP